MKVVEAKASAAKDLCGWCLAINTYAAVSKKVEPKKKLAKDLELKLNIANESLNKKMAELKISYFNLF